MTHLERELPTVSPECGSAYPLHLSMGVPGGEGEVCRANLAKKANIVSTFADGGIAQDVEDHRDRVERGQYFGPLGQRVFRSARARTRLTPVKLRPDLLRAVSAAKAPRPRRRIDALQHVFTLLRN
jgi:hypothetical protein